MEGHQAPGRGWRTDAQVYRRRRRGHHHRLLPGRRLSRRLWPGCGQAASCSSVIEPRASRLSLSLSLARSLSDVAATVWLRYIWPRTVTRRLNDSFRRYQSEHQPPTPDKAKGKAPPGSVRHFLVSQAPAVAGMLASAQCASSIGGGVPSTWQTLRRGEKGQKGRGRECAALLYMSAS